MPLKSKTPAKKVMGKPVKAIKQPTEKAFKAPKVAYRGLIKSWSWSRYSDYKQCPFKAKLKHVDKLKEPGNDAMQRGNDIHKLAEDYIKGFIKKLPVELKHFKADVDQLKKMAKSKISLVTIEESWTFTEDWKTKTRFDDWANAWVRIKVDAAHFVNDDILIVTDWKTGKFREEMNADYVEQLELYALAAFFHYPHINQVWPRLVYLDVPMVYPPPHSPIIFTREKDFERLAKMWYKRILPMLNDTKFPIRPNDKCKWCHFRKSNGGPCKI